MSSLVHLFQGSNTSIVRSTPSIFYLYVYLQSTTIYDVFLVLVPFLFHYLHPTRLSQRTYYTGDSPPNLTPFPHSVHRRTSFSRGRSRSQGILLERPKRPPRRSFGHTDLITNLLPVHPQSYTRVSSSVSDPVRPRGPVPFWKPKMRLTLPLGALLKLFFVLI